MGIKLQTEPTFKTICTIGRDESRALLNIFDCMMDNENGYDDLERILDYRIDNLLANIEHVKEELEKYVANKKAEIFNSRIEERAEESMRLSFALASGA